MVRLALVPLLLMGCAAPVPSGAPTTRCNPAPPYDEGELCQDWVECRGERVDRDCAWVVRCVDGVVETELTCTPAPLATRCAVFIDRDIGRECAFEDRCPRRVSEVDFDVCREDGWRCEDGRLAQYTEAVPCPPPTTRSSCAGVGRFDVGDPCTFEERCLGDLLVGETVTETGIECVDGVLQTYEVSAPRSEYEYWTCDRVGSARDGDRCSFGSRCFIGESMQPGACENWWVECQAGRIVHVHTITDC